MGKRKGNMSLKGIAASMVRKADVDGYAPINGSVYLMTQSCVIADSKNWGEEDYALVTDFSRYPYWIIGAEFSPIPIRGWEDVADELRGMV
jgi:hypothetical protein